MEYTEIKVKEIIPDPESEGCFRLVLEELEEGMELPIVIGMPDARPLLEKLEGERNFRPQTHDLFQDFIDTSGYRLDRFEIRDFHCGVFFGSLHFKGNEEAFDMDCRPSDGVALALRSKCPMYVHAEVLKRVGALMSNDMSRMNVSQRIRVMEKKLKRLISEERYEEAGILRDRINTLKTGQTS